MVATMARGVSENQAVNIQRCGFNRDLRSLVCIDLLILEYHRHGYSYGYVNVKVKLSVGHYDFGYRDSKILFISVTPCKINE